MKVVYLVVSCAVMVISVVIHVFTRIRVVEQTVIWSVLVIAALLCAPLVALYVRVSRTYHEEIGIWETFWGEAYRGVPKWLFPLSGLAAVNLMILWALDFAGYPVKLQAFPSSCAPICSAVAFTHAWSLVMRSAQKAAEPE